MLATHSRRNRQHAPISTGRAVKPQHRSWCLHVLQVFSDDERPSADVSKASLTAAASESETSFSTFSSSLQPLQPARPSQQGATTKRADVVDELSTPITPIAEDHGSVGNDEADDDQLSDASSSDVGLRRGRPANFAHAR